MPASRVTVNTWAVTDADGNKLRRRVVAVLHAGEGGGSVDGLLIAKWAEATTDATTGIATFQLYSNDDIDQAGSFYSFTVCDVDPTVVRRYEIPAGAEVDLPDLTEVEPVGFSGFVPNPSTGTSGQVLTTNGTTASWSTITAETVRPLVLGADWCLVADRAIGVNRWADQGRAGIDARNSGRGAAPLPAAGWDDLRPLGPFISAVGAAWPDLLDVRWKGRVLPQRRDPSNEWSEVLLATIDEDEDWLEPAYVFTSSGWRIGLNVRFAGEASERGHQFSTEVVAGEDVAWRVTMDGTNLKLWSKGYAGSLSANTGWTELESTTVAGMAALVPGSETSAPYSLAAPPEGTVLSVARSGALVSEVLLLDDIDGATLHHFDTGDAAAGDTTVTTDGEEWSAAFGLVSASMPSRRFIYTGQGWSASDAAVFDLEASDSFTVAVAGRVWPVGPSGVSSVVSCNGTGLLTGGAGWAIGSVQTPLGFEFGLLVTDGAALVAADAGEVPTGSVVLVAVVDRSTDEARVYVDGVLAATADASALGAVASGDVTLDFADLDYVATWRRALDADEITYLTNGAGA